MVDQHDILVQEVNEDLQRERLLRLWERYGLYIVAGAALLILSVFVYKLQDKRAREAAEQDGARYITALKAAAGGKIDEARPQLAAIVDAGGPGYAALARLRLAGADAKAGKTTEAAAAFEAIAADRNADPLLADYARLQAAVLKLDTSSWTDMQNRLTPLASDENAWRFSAREMLGIAALKSGNANEARIYFERLLGDRGTPPGMGERVRLMMAMLTEAEISKAGGTQPTAGAPPAATTPAAATPAVTPRAVAPTPAVPPAKSIQSK